jgi:hypothetical protein
MSAILFSLLSASPHLLHSRCGINKGLIKRGSIIDHWRSHCKGRILWPNPYTHIYTYKSTFHNIKQDWWEDISLLHSTTCFEPSWSS